MKKKKVSIVTIAVTPFLLEENNYVLNVEYPLAMKYNKKIVPIEVVKTDYEKMKSLYKDFPRYYDLDDESDFNEIYKTCDGLKVTNDLSTDNRYYPSSKMCSSCSPVKDKLSLSSRTYICSSCGLSINRDLNASINLLNFNF